MKWLFAFSVFVLVAGIGGRAEAQNYPWCAYYSGGDDGGGTNCGFVSRDQCMASVSGIGGFCTPNNTYVPPPGAAAPSHAPRKPRRS